MEGQHKFVTTKRGVTINFTASRGRVTFFYKKCKGRAARFYIHAHRDSSGPPPLLKNESSLRVKIANFDVATIISHIVS